ncbi:MAG: F0F1 ATP synthase subunit alpha, partial [Acutalibacteraceae bacterium]
MATFEFAPVGEFLKKQLAELPLGAKIYEYGTVESCNGDVVNIKGLSGARYGEILELENGVFAMALDLHLDGAGAVLLNGKDEIEAGSVVKGTGRVASVGVGKELLGRIIDPLGRPLDEKPLTCGEFRPVEMPAPSIVDRSPVNRPLETGILAVDSMIPIGRGQRELIIGDRQTGKTSIALSAMIHQANTHSGVICIYCAIGQKNSNVMSVVQSLKAAGALENSVVLSASSDSCAALQYLAPYAACSIGEYFMNQGSDVLVVYDDLSKHAVAYRAMSLLLRRPAGREAYPGDVFYLHSRLLERAAKLSDEKGGGSMTALPIVETMAGDISAYIPTNVISITDGQIYLESELFNSGVKPAINVGLSVSRVGRSAQFKAIKKVSGALRLQIAQYRDLAVFMRFGSDMDSTTAAMLHKGEVIMELLKQNVNEDMSTAKQCLVLYAA